MDLCLPHVLKVSIVSEDPGKASSPLVSNLSQTLSGTRIPAIKGLITGGARAVAQGEVWGVDQSPLVDR